MDAHEMKTLDIPQDGIGGQHNSAISLRGSMETKRKTDKEADDGQRRYVVPETGKENTHLLYIRGGLDGQQLRAVHYI
jgi:hypothetical protein